jgi:hypothetical protein
MNDINLMMSQLKSLKVHQQQRCGAIEHQMEYFNHKKGKSKISDISSSVSLIK